MGRIWHVTAVTLLLLVTLSAGNAAERREWVALTDCRYVADKDNDGDSFLVHCGAKEFIVRLYFVDAPETNLRYPERTREQSEYFGVTLDETIEGPGPRPETTCRRCCGGPLSWRRAGQTHQAEAAICAVAPWSR